MFRLAYADEIDGQIHTQSGLSVTPAQAKEMMKKGRNVSMPECPPNYFDDGSDSASIVDSEIPLIHKRAVDMNDIWLESEAAKEKFNQARISERERKAAQKEMDKYLAELEEKESKTDK